ncbi:hypothetical protein MKX01_023271 [Papaver californicum]|nr:hypothetical protein MKX01_023271 [Papaver californicum]
MYYNGIYHLFYQYNPKAAAWASDIVWGHSVSKDMVNWFRLDVSMSPTDSFDINGCWSGSATILPGNKPVMLYTGIDINNVQIQNIAIPKDSSDPLLVEWKKLDENPLIFPPIGINATSFWDPTTACLGKDGSEDFMTWTESENNFHSAPDTGIWECPDFFPVSLKGKKGLDTSTSGDDVQYILKVSVQRAWSDFYTVGNYCLTRMSMYLITHYVIRELYASKTFFDEAKNRRVLWAWVNESDSAADDFAKGWAGFQWPIKELETLRTNEVKLKKTPLIKGSLFEVQGITAAQIFRADIKVRFRLPSLENAEPFDPYATVQGGIGPFGLLTLASKDLDEYTAVFFRVFKAQDKPVVLMCSGGIRSSLTAELDKPSYGAFVDVDLIHGEISLRSLIDHTVVESFGAGGKTCITTRVYPTLAVGKEAHLYAFNNRTGTVEIKRLNAWTMQTPKMNLGTILQAFNGAMSETGSSSADVLGINRTGYHFQSPKNWINGPMYYNGIYHLFYQYNPEAVIWESALSWGHSVSKDMVNWFRLDVAMSPTDSFDINGCWSVIPTPDDITPDKFRDPTTGWLGEDGYWRILIGSEKSNKVAALLFKSNDFMTWTESENAFHSAEPDTGMWECLDFFPVSLKGKEALDTSARGDDIKYVFKVSIQDTSTDFYTVGNYFVNNGEYYIPDNTIGDPYSPVTGLRLDYGKFYASKTFFDEAKNRRILWGWVNEPDSPADAIARGWAGIQADIEVTFRIANLENAELFDPSWVDAQQLSDEKGATVKGGIGPFGLLTLASKDVEEYTAVFFRVFRAQDKYVVLMCSGVSRSSLREGLHKPSYGAFWIFGAGGKACITTRTYPTLAVGKETHLYAFNYGTGAVEIAKLNAWTIKTPEMNLSDGIALLTA